MSLFICVGNFKGGVGKTTTAINFSSLLAKIKTPTNEGKPVNTLLLDLDPQFNASLSLGFNMKDLNRFDKENLVCVRYKYIPNLFIGVYNGKIFENIFSLPEINKFDYIVIDAPPKNANLYKELMKYVNYIIVPVQCEYFILEGLAQFFSLFERVKIQSNPKLQILSILPTIFEFSAHNFEVLAELKKHFSKKVASSIIPKDNLFSESISYGKPIFLYSPYSIGALAYLRFTLEVIDDVKNAWQKF